MTLYLFPTLVLIPPEDVSIIVVTDDSIYLTWTPPIATYDYILVSCVNSQGGNNVTDNLAVNNNGVCTGLTPGAIYTIEVSSVNDQVEPATALVDSDTITSMSKV